MILVGGLYNLENELKRQFDSIYDLQQEYLRGIRNAGLVGISRQHSTYEILQEMFKKYTKYEESLTHVSYRRMMALSQGDFN